MCSARKSNGARYGYATGIAEYSRPAPSNCVVVAVNLRVVPTIWVRPVEMIRDMIDRKRSCTDSGSSLNRPLTMTYTVGGGIARSCRSAIREKAEGTMKGTDVVPST